MQEFDAFDRRFPLRQMTIGGISFPYRHHVHSQNRETLLLLTGGIGLSDLFFHHFAAFAKDFSVLTCDYPLHCTTMAQLTDTLAQLLRTLGIRAWLVGHSEKGCRSNTCPAKNCQRSVSVDDAKVDQILWTAYAGTTL